MSATCANCEAVVAGRFCASCGQDARHRLTVTEFGQQVAGGLLNLDSRLWRTLRDLAVPGRITAEYLAGRRVRYLPPVQTYLVAALLFFSILPSGTSAMLTDGAYRATIRAEAAAEGIDFDARHARERSRNLVWEEERAAFEQRAAKFSLLMFALLPLLALALYATHFSSPLLYLEHLVFTFHLQTAVWLVLGLQLGVERLLLALWWPPLPAWAWLVTPLLLFGYAIAALRRVTDATWSATTLRAVGVLAAYLLLLGSLGATTEWLWGRA